MNTQYIIMAITLLCSISLECVDLYAMKAQTTTTTVVTKEEKGLTLVALAKEIVLGARVVEFELLGVADLLKGSHVCKNKEGIILPVHTVLLAGRLEHLIPFLRARKAQSSPKQWDEFINERIFVDREASSTLMHLLVEAIYRGRIKNQEDVVALLEIFRSIRPVVDVTLCTPMRLVGIYLQCIKGKIIDNNHAKITREISMEEYFEVKKDLENIMKLLTQIKAFFADVV